MVAITLIGSFYLDDSLYAQQPAPAPLTYTDVELKSQDIVPTLVDAPVSAGNFGDAPPDNEFLKGKKWLQIKFEFTAVDQVKGYIEELKFKISVEGRELHDLNDKMGVPVILTGETTFLNVPAKINGSKSQGYFFIHPSVLDRFGGVAGRGFKFFGTTKSAGNSNIRIEASIGGQAVPLDPQTKSTYVDLLRDDPKWVDQCKPVPHQVYGKNESPWAMAWAESSLMIKPQSESGNGL